MVFKNKTFLLILYFVLIICQTNDTNDKLIFTMIHFRHGARAPLIDGHIDDFGEEWEHSDELTGIGERMHYLLGYRNHIRYIKEKKLLSEKFNIDELLIFSTKVNRTIMSLLSHLQGLYPQNNNLGYYLNEYQLNNSNPPVSLNYTEIQEEIIELKFYSLPNSMTVIPFEIQHVPSFCVTYMSYGCLGAIRAFNRSLTTNTYSVVEEFNKNYARIINEFSGINSHNYSYYEIFNICDDFIAAYTEGRNFTKFKKTGINIEEFNSLCKRALQYFYRDYVIRGNEITFLEGSKIMELLINYTKISIDADIINSNSSKVTSYPKFLIYSGHETTVSKQELFLIKSLGLDLDDYYRFPTYTSQIAFEISRKDDDKKNRSYSDYFVNYYFNDEHLLNISADEFINKIEVNIWSDEKINAFCGYSSNNTNNNSNNNNTSDKNNTSTDVTNNSTEVSNNNNSTEGSNNVNNNEIIYSFLQKNQKSYKVLFIVFFCLFGVSFIGNIILFLLWVRKNSNNFNKESPVLKKF